ncbi:MAG: dTDP-4-dehydrorhamnose reductase [Alteraurantiacibacter sp.]
MKVLLTGANGQLGRALLATAPAGVYIEAKDRANCDLANRDAIAAMVADCAPDLVVNTAAYTAVDAAETDEATAVAVNAEALAALVAAHDGKLVHISTDFVFDGKRSRAYKPGDTRNPLNAYGRSKAAGEDRLREADLLVRTSWLYDAGSANFVTTMLRLMQERGEVRVVADQIAAPTWARGLAQTIWKLVDADASGAFHHSDAGVASWYDFAVAIQEEARALGLLERSVPVVPVSTADFPTPAKRPAFSLLDSSATRAVLGEAAVHWRMNLWHMLRAEKARG